MTTAGQRIRQAREARDLSTREAAKLIGIGKSTLSEIENGDSKFPSAEVLFRMADVLGVSARWIVFGEDGEMHIPTPEESQLLDAIRELPEESRVLVASLINTLKTQPK
jgi:transcriptional regulator with XRE-family HTH domain